MDYYIRTMSEDDLPSIAEMRSKANEFLNSHDQIAAWFKLYPEGFKVAVSLEGVVIGVCAAVPEGENLYHIGIYMVLENYRGQGIGTKLWKTVWKYMGNAVVITNAQRPMVEKYIATFPIIQSSYKRLGYVTNDPINVDLLNIHHSEEIKIEAFKELHLPAIFEYDRNLTGYKRSTILAHSCLEKRNSTYIAFKNGTCVGFGTLRIGCRGHGLIGPLYCDSSDIAEALLEALMKSRNLDKGIAMITMDINDAAKTMMTRLNCAVEYESSAMYTKEEAMEQFFTINMNKIYGLFCKSFALF